jgi:hypothetical protein
MLGAMVLDGTPGRLLTKDVARTRDAEREITVNEDDPVIARSSIENTSDGNDPERVPRPPDRPGMG